MTTELIERLRDAQTRDTVGEWSDRAEAADALEAQAKYIRELEDANTPELVALRAQLEEIAATEPAWFHRVGFHGDHRFYDQTETQPEGCTPLFTRPMPAQDVTELVGLMRYMRDVASFERNDEIDAALYRYKGAK